VVKRTKPSPAGGGHVLPYSGAVLRAMVRRSPRCIARQRLPHVGLGQAKPPGDLRCFHASIEGGANSVQLFTLPAETPPFVAKGTKESQYLSGNWLTNFVRALQLSYDPRTSSRRRWRPSDLGARPTQTIWNPPDSPPPARPARPAPALTSTHCSQVPSPIDQT
jgi:hypothetical protein